MKISSLNSINFKSNYQFNITVDNFPSAINTLGDLEAPMLSDSAYFVFDDYTSYQKQRETGIIQEITISADDKYDEFIESKLKQANINFVKQSKKDSLNPDNIYNRLILSENNPSDTLISLDTKKVDELFKKDEGFYISKNAESGAISRRYEDVKKFLETGKEIHASKVYLREENDELFLYFQDGRHRYAVMRDMGMDKIKFSLDEDSLKLAYKYGLVREEN